MAVLAGVSGVEVGMTIDDVVYWCKLYRGGGVSHIVTHGINGDYVMTACGTMANDATVTKDKPKRICRRCREALAYLRPAKEGGAK